MYLWQCCCPDTVCEPHCGSTSCTPPGHTSTHGMALAHGINAGADSSALPLHLSGLLAPPIAPTHAHAHMAPTHAAGCCPSRAAPARSSVQRVGRAHADVDVVHRRQRGLVELHLGTRDKGRRGHGKGRSNARAQAPELWRRATLVIRGIAGPYLERRFVHSRYVLPAWTSAHHVFGATAQQAAPSAVPACRD